MQVEVILDLISFAAAMALGFEGLGESSTKLKYPAYYGILGNCMAYLRTEKESFEIDYSIEKVWDAIPEVVKYLNWTIEEKDDQKYTAKLKSKPGFLAYATILFIEALSVDQKTCKMTINAETPVTTITSIADFGRTRDRLAQFVDELSKEMARRRGKPKDEPKV